MDRSCFSDEIFQRIDETFFRMSLLSEVRNETSFGIMKLLSDLSDLSEVRRYRTTVSTAVTAVT